VHEAPAQRKVVVATREFYLFKRRGVYYAQFIDPQTGHTKLQKSTGKISEDDLYRLIGTLKEAKYIESALIANSSSTAKFIKYQKAFWDFDTSLYIREKLLQGQRIGRYHTLDCQHRIHYWLEYFGKDVMIGEVTSQKIRDFSL
jgi:hypothetical protein